MSSAVTVVEINEGQKIAWEQDNTKLTFGDDELMVNAARYQRDWPTHLDICGDDDGNLVIGVGEGRFYVVQLDIPAIQYTEDGDPETRDPIPLEMSDVVLTLWAIDGFRA